MQGPHIKLGLPCFQIKMRSLLVGLFSLKQFGSLSQAKCLNKVKIITQSLNFTLN